jgi:hypothetical protein
MRPTFYILRVLAILLIILLAALSAQIFLGGINAYSERISTPTVVPETGFVLDIPQQALLKNYVVVSAQTTPGTNCELIFIPPSGDIKKMDAQADEYGMCIWRWKLEESLGKGHGRLIFTIDGRSETHFFQIRSSF